MKRVLIANRGEIAVRIIRACRDLGLSPIAVYGPGEEHAVHVRLADDAYSLTSDSALPYLDVDAILAAARRSGADAVHPGYGFLSENAEFVRAVELLELVFVGPSADAVHALGDKVRAREIAIEAEVPVVPGTEAAVESADDAARVASEIGYPLAIKAAAGGGGRGFRVAYEQSELQEAMQGAAGEAERYFGDATVYIERYLERPRHIEIQLMADAHGNAVWLGERDCSIQRRHQKLIEETPSPAVDEGLRQELGDAAIRLARAVGYVNAGTVEFLLSEDGNFYFLEMNSRIQVEHTITEEVTGIDLVKEQLLVASGCELSFDQADVQPRGHAIQCRINAEDAGAGFKPVAGTISRFTTPDGPGIRVDTAVEPGAEILPMYDSMVAKLVSLGRDRDESIARMKRALGEFAVEGVPTTIPFHRLVMENPAFAAGDATTAFLVEHEHLVVPASSEQNEASQAQRTTPQEVVVEVDGRRLSVRIHRDDSYSEQTASTESRPRLSDRSASVSNNGSAGNEIRSPLQGTVVRLAVGLGDSVAEGDLVCVIEAMKMENEISAHRGGTIASLEIEPGNTVVEGTLIASLE